jgi:hypothetical protein
LPGGVSAAQRIRRVLAMFDGHGINHEESIRAGRHAEAGLKKWT